MDNNENNGQEISTNDMMIYMHSYCEHDENYNLPCILHFDSLMLHSSKTIAKHIQYYLHSEIRTKLKLLSTSLSIPLNEINEFDDANNKGKLNVEHFMKIILNRILTVPILTMENVFIIFFNNNFYLLLLKYFIIIYK